MASPARSNRFLPRLGLALLVSCGAMLAGASTAKAQNTPPMRLLVAPPAGSAPDIFARVIAEGMSKRLGQTVLVENRPGANGNVAAQAVLQQPADGNTLWVGTQSMVEINPSAFSVMPWKPADFTPIVKGVEAPLVLAVHTSVPANTFEEFVSWAKKERGNVSYASFSPGTPSHFLGYQLSERFDLDMVHIPYRGSAPQVTDMMGGHSPVGFTQMLTVLPALQSNNLKALATTGSQRSRFLPDVPTLNELGMPEMDTTIWFGLFASSKTPPERVAQITEAAVESLKDPELRKKLEDAGFDVSGQTGESFEKSIETQRERWAKLVKATGFSANE